jgi:hypothetical protein
MTSPKIKGPTPFVAKGTGTGFARSALVPATAAAPDPYAPNNRGVSTRNDGTISGPVSTRKARGQFRVVEFARAILQHGYFLSWTKAVICPCMNPETEQTLVNCPTCDGSGFYYTDPLTIRGLMANLDRNEKIFEKFGTWVEGGSMVTTEAQYRLGYRDRIEHLDAVMAHNELFQKGNRRGTRSRLPERCDSMRYRVSRMTKLFVSGAGVDAACCAASMLPEGVTEIDDHTIVTLEEGYHYTVTKDGWVQWTHKGDLFVSDGAWVSALYEYHPVYIVVSHPHATRMEVVETKSPTPKPIALPVQARVQLDVLADINSPVPSMTTPKAA